MEPEPKSKPLQARQVRGFNKRVDRANQPQRTMSGFFGCISAPTSNPQISVIDTLMGLYSNVGLSCAPVARKVSFLAFMIIQQLRQNSEPLHGRTWQVAAFLQRTFSRSPNKTLMKTVRGLQRTFIRRRRHKDWSDLKLGGSSHVFVNRKTKYLLDLNDEFISKQIFTSGSADYFKFELVLRLLKVQSIDLLIDVGANIGEISLEALVSNKAKSAICIEPDPENTKLLETNALLNGFSNPQIFRLHGVAAGTGEPKHLRLIKNKKNYGDHRILGLNANASSAFEEIVEVPNLRLDSIVSIPSGKLSVLFIDVQGYEIEVLKGAAELLQQRVPTVLEISPLHLEEHGSIAELIGLFSGYQGYFDLGLHRPALQGFECLEDRYQKLLSSGSYTDILVS